MNGITKWGRKGRGSLRCELCKMSRSLQGSSTLQAQVQLRISCTQIHGRHPALPRMDGHSSRTPAGLDSPATAAPGWVTLAADYRSSGGLTAFLKITNNGTHRGVFEVHHGDNQAPKMM